MLDGMAREPNQFDDLFVPVDVQAPPLPADIGLPRPQFFPPPTATTPKACCASAAGCRPSGCSTPIATASFPGRCGTTSRSPGGRPIRGRSSSSIGFTSRGGLQRTLRSGKFRVTCDRDFEGVIRGCATAGDRERQHVAHAQHDRGLLPDARAGPRTQRGSVVDSFPPGEGRGEGADVHPHPNPLPRERGFWSAARTASPSAACLRRRACSIACGMRRKLRVVHLVAHLRARGYELFDIQQWTPHTARFGAIEIPRVEYLRRLAQGGESARHVW